MYHGLDSMPMQSGVRIKMCLIEERTEKRRRLELPRLTLFSAHRLRAQYVWRANLIPRTLDLLDAHIQENASRGHDLATHSWKHENIELIERALNRPLIEHIMEYMKN